MNYLVFLQLRAFTRSVKRRAGGCWQWTGTKDDSGYGRFFVGNRKDGTYITMKAHKYAYLLHRGEIPQDKELDHTCRNRACVNPLHLEIVTRRENMHRAWKAKPHWQSAKEMCRRGHRYDDANTYRTSDGRHRICRACRRETYKNRRK